MTRKLVAVLAALNALGSLRPAFGDQKNQEGGEIVQTQKVGFESGSIIHVLHSFGTLSVEGWDRPEVEVTVIKSVERCCAGKLQDESARALNRIEVNVVRRSDNDLVISTILPRKLFARLLGDKGSVMRSTGNALDKVTGIARHPFGGNGGLVIEYQIHAPRDSRLVIQHGTGRLLVTDIAGDMQATSKGGDIVLMLPDSGAYSIDAKSKLGTVTSDLDGASHRRRLVGSGFERGATAPAHQIHARTGVGGITIKAVPAEAAERTVTGHDR